MGLYDFTVYDMIRRNAGCFGSKQAWLEVDDERTLTFAEFKKCGQACLRLAEKWHQKNRSYSSFGQKTALNISFCMELPPQQVQSCCRSTGDFPLKK